MDIVSAITVGPVVALILGALVGLGFGRLASDRAGLWLLAAVTAVCLALIGRLIGIAPGEEMDAFVPFAALTGGVFPALFGGVLGWLLGRAWRRRQ